MKKLLLIYFTMLAGICQAQDIFQKNLYSAERIMEMREELKLTDDQISKIKKVHSENAGEFTTLKWDLDEATSKLKNLLDQTKIDQTSVQKQMETVLRIENQLKKKQLNNLVTIKNELNEEQQKKLQSSKNLTVYGYNNFPSKSISGTASGGSRIVVGKSNLTGVTGSSAHTIKVAGSKDSEQPVYYLDTKSGYKKLISLETTDPNEIESIHVLKDKSAIEKFGDEGKNGVIIIKLKDNMPK